MEAALQEMLADPAKMALSKLPWSRPRGKVLTTERERERERESGVIVCECKRQNDYMCVNGMPHTPQTGLSLTLSLSLVFKPIS